METFVETFIVLIIIIISLILIPQAIIYVLKNKFKNRSWFRLSILFTFIFYGMTITSSLFLMMNPTEVNLDDKIQFTGENIGESTNKELVFSKATSIFNKIKSFNYTDPTSFIYDDSPSKGFQKIRELNIIKSDKVSYSSYYLNDSGDLIPTLLRIDPDLIPFERASDLRNYVSNFLTRNNSISDLNLEIKILNRHQAFGKSYREVQIKLYESDKDDMLLIIFSYDLKSGFSETINLVYTTKSYSFDKVSTVYLEVIYKVQGYDLVVIGFFSLLVSLFLLVLSLISLYVHRSTSNKNNKEFLIHDNWKKEDV